jgi:hypothetical protein
MRSIDIAWFECLNCGHRSTPPAAVNAIPHQMEVIEVYRGRVVDDPLAEGGKRAEIPTIANEAAHKAQLEQKYQGNTVIIRNEGIDRVVRLARSYAKAEHDKTELAESDHITLKCPQCDNILYDVRWDSKRR